MYEDECSQLTHIPPLAWTPTLMSAEKEVVPKWEASIESDDNCEDMLAIDTDSPPEEVVFSVVV